MNKFTVRLLRRKDLPSIQKLDNESGFDVYDWVETGENNDFAWGAFLTDSDEEKLIGYCTTGEANDVPASIENHFAYEPADIVLSDVFISKEFRGNDYGKKMIKAALSYRRSLDGDCRNPVYISVMRDDLEGFYGVLGFERVSPDKDYFDGYMVNLGYDEPFYTLPSPWAWGTIRHSYENLLLLKEVLIELKVDGYSLTRNETGDELKESVPNGVWQVWRSNIDCIEYILTPYIPNFLSQREELDGLILQSIYDIDDTEVFIEKLSDFIFKTKVF